MIINKPYTNKEYADLAVYCNQNNCHIEDKGDYLESVENQPFVPTKGDIEKMREQAYTKEVDPITCHINRLKDEEQTEEIIAEIEELKELRNHYVQEIKERFPYPDEEEKLS